MKNLYSGNALLNSIYTKIKSMPYGALELSIYNHTAKFIKYPVTVAGEYGHGGCIPELKTFGIMSLDGSSLEETPTSYGSISDRLIDWVGFMKVLDINWIEVGTCENS